ncbi:hypothetical protein BCR41DRAFT_361934 [Lobosporangium transversale]|uniref:Uncharacterized protein n=1 Tax=Lobosporangium transversale TaxID=64571 RepID=A0A1Y2GA97_9FUNG|nr:hypothetical protein BCR41DRAFT_361934 [Lobosporangium transversale]ORZ05354.1 hypothetical protein BCR41DRAFT_361934 [Lobosporangium transversale]|eukprot:XP_021877046.1 hypothetical protein BCR41DRAFT_361934 [Lobosporangium transversale]
MEIDSPYDEWSNNIHAVITFLKPFFDDWRSYASLVSALMGIGVLIMENQVLLRMRMGRWEILGYVLWCIISSFLGPVFDIFVMLGLFAYCRHKSARMHITNESIAKALLPPPIATNYRIMGATCVISSILTLCSNVLYMLRGWEEPLPFYDWSSNAIRWMTSQLWYAIGMIFLLHVITRPAQSGVVLFGKFPRDLWAFKWQLCILYLPVRYMLLQLCDIHRDSKHILIPLEIVVDIVLYNGPFLIILLRLLYLAWKVAYDEAILTGAIYEDDSNASVCSLFDIRSYFLNSNGDHTRRGSATTIQGTNGYVGLAMMDLDEAEQGRSRVMVQERSGRNSMSQVNASSANKGKSEYAESLDSRSVGGQPSGSPPAYDSRDYLQAPKSFSPKMTGKAASKTCPRNSPRTSPKTSSPLRNVVFSLDSSDDEDSEEEHRRH